MPNTSQQLLIISAPSGAGKTTLINHLMSVLHCLEFSISATNRPPRIGETDGKEYYFFSTVEFKNLIAQDKFVEWEEVYQGRYYGTLKSEIARISQQGKTAIFDVDVKGGLNIKKLYGNHALSIFIHPPSMEVLEQRLKARGTDNSHDIENRIAKATEELSYSNMFDRIIINDNVDTAKNELITVVSDFLNLKHE